MNKVCVYINKLYVRIVYAIGRFIYKVGHNMEMYAYKVMFSRPCYKQSLSKDKDDDLIAKKILIQICLLKNKKEKE